MADDGRSVAAVILPTPAHRLSNARMEAANTTRLITRRAYGAP